ncbi:hypothetical protein M6B38_169975 [Iris pallida]|uniref:Maturase K n=1 Tax=Iris pallida TaxID=29817 RepID=A0AAX6EVY8_IRIPA|nr:hypothetical protein M6B38_169975 [Iris pallida]
MIKLVSASYGSIRHSEMCPFLDLGLYYSNYASKTSGTSGHEEDVVDLLIVFPNCLGLTFRYLCNLFKI